MYVRTDAEIIQVLTKNTTTSAMARLRPAAPTLEKIKTLGDEG